MALSKSWLENSSRDKPVESIWFLCLDEGSTPSSSTRKGPIRGPFLWSWGSRGPFFISLTRKRSLWSLSGPPGPRSPRPGAFLWSWGSRGPFFSSLVRTRSISFRLAALRAGAFPAHILFLFCFAARLRRRRLACPRNGRPSGSAVSLQAFARTNTFEPALRWFEGFF